MARRSVQAVSIKPSRREGRRYNDLVRQRDNAGPAKGGLTTPSPKPAALPLAGSALLELQRRAGNRATTAALRAASAVPRVAVQRAVGFEFEIAQSEVREANDVTQVAAAAQHNASRDLSHRLPKGAGGIWGRSPGVDYEADDAGDRSHVEFVTHAFNEDPAGRRELETAVSAIVAFQPAYINQVVAHDRVGIAGTPGYIPGRSPLASDFDGQIQGYASTKPGAFFPVMGLFRAKPQATVGLRLEKLHTLMSGAFPRTTETGPERAARDPNRLGLSGVDSGRYGQAQQNAANGQPLLHGMRIMQVLDQALERAEASVAAFCSGHPAAPPASAQLISLLGLVYAYLDMGRSGLVRTYAKTIAPVMARTDFATLFAQLDPLNRDYYRSADGRRWIKLVKTNSAYNWFNIGDAIFSGGIEASQEPNDWFVDLSRKAWLKDMTRGTDRLTAAHYPSARGRGEIEGLGGYGSQMDVTAGGQNAPIFELRSIPEMPLSQIRGFALNLFDYVVALNSSNPYTFVAHPPPTPPALAPLIPLPGG